MPIAKTSKCIGPRTALGDARSTTLRPNASPGDLQDLNCPAVLAEDRKHVVHMLCWENLRNNKRSFHAACHRNIKAGLVGIVWPSLSCASLLCQELTKDHHHNSFPKAWFNHRCGRPTTLPTMLCTSAGNKSIKGLSGPRPSRALAEHGNKFCA